MALISAVVPVHNEQACLGRLYAELSSALKALGMPYEIVFVDDGSTDSSLEAIARIQREDPAVAAVVLTRNFGHQMALTAGLEFARGDAVVTLDADLQHPPALIGSLVEKWRQGAKVVHAVRARNADAGWGKRLASRSFYRVLGLLSDTPVQADSADFRLLDRQAVDALKTLKERHRFLRGMVGWMGFSEASVPYEAGTRAAGLPKYTWRKMFRMAADAIASFSIWPLRVALWLGFAALMVNLAYACYVLYVFFFKGGAIKGWSSLVLMTTFIGSVELLLLGVVGEYVGRIYEELKARPLYLVRELRPSRGQTADA